MTFLETTPNVVEIKKRIQGNLRSENLTEAIIWAIERDFWTLESIDPNWSRLDPELAGLHQGYLTRLEAINVSKNKALNLTAILTTARLRQEKLKMQIGKPVENAEIRKKMQYVTKYLEFLHDPMYKDDVEAQIGKFLELTREQTEYIEDREFLQRKYISAIYAHMRRHGHIIKRDKAGEYGVYQIGSKGPGEINVIPYTSGKYVKAYQKLLGTHKDDEYKWWVNDTLLEFARLNSIVRENDLNGVDRKVGQRTILVNLLERLEIFDENKVRITKPEMLLMDRTNVLSQIEKLMVSVTQGSDKNLKTFQELLYLKDFVERDYAKTEFNRKLIQDVNDFRLFINEKSLTDVFKGNVPPELQGKTTGQVLGDVWGEIALMAIPVGLFIMLFGDKKLGALTMLSPLALILWGKLFDGGKWAIEKIKWSKLSLTMNEAELELVHPLELHPELTIPAQFQPIYKKLLEKNKEAKLAPKAGGAYTPWVMNDFIVGEILSLLVEKRGSLTRNFNRVDASTVDDIWSIIAWRSRTIDIEWISWAIPSEVRGKKITKADLEKFLQLLLKVKDKEDVSVFDALQVGRSPESASYKSINFTGVREMDQSINEVMRTAFTDPSVTVETKEIIIEAQASLQKWLEKTYLAVDFSRPSFEIKALDSVVDRVSRIQGIIQEIRGWNLYTAIQDSIIETLNKYVLFLETEEEVKNLRLWWTTSVKDFVTLVADPRKSKVEKIHAYNDRKTEAERQLALVQTKATALWVAPRMGIDVFASLRTLIQKVEADYTAQISDYSQKIVQLEKEIDEERSLVSWSVLTFSLSPTRKALIENSLSSNPNKLASEITSELTSLQTFFRWVSSWDIGKIHSLLNDPKHRNSLEKLRAYYEVFSDTAYDATAAQADSAGWVVKTIRDLFDDSLTTGNDLVKVQVKISQAYTEYFRQNKALQDRITSSATWDDALLQNAAWFSAFVNQIGSIKSEVLSKGSFNDSYNIAKFVFDGFIVRNDGVTIDSLSQSIAAEINAFSTGLWNYAVNDATKFDAHIVMLKTAKTFENTVLSKTWFSWAIIDKFIGNFDQARLKATIADKTKEALNSKITSVNLNVTPGRTFEQAMGEIRRIDSTIKELETLGLASDLNSYSLLIQQKIDAGIRNLFDSVDPSTIDTYDKFNNAMRDLDYIAGSIGSGFSIQIPGVGPFFIWKKNPILEEISRKKADIIEKMLTVVATIGGATPTLSQKIDILNRLKGNLGVINDAVRKADIERQIWERLESLVLDTVNAYTVPATINENTLREVNSIITEIKKLPVDKQGPAKDAFKAKLVDTASKFITWYTLKTDAPGLKSDIRTLATAPIVVKLWATTLSLNGVYAPADIAPEATALSQKIKDARVKYIDLKVSQDAELKVILDTLARDTSITGIAKDELRRVVRDPATQIVEATAITSVWWVVWILGLPDVAANAKFDTLRKYFLDNKLTDSNFKI